VRAWFPMHRSCEVRVLALSAEVRFRFASSGFGRLHQRVDWPLRSSFLDAVQFSADTVMSRRGGALALMQGEYFASVDLEGTTLTLLCIIG
jgi:hypothetical protein